jgi:hypothetical protein
MEYGYADKACAGTAGQNLKAVEQTELQSLLHTINDQAYEIRSLARVVLDRVCPQPEEDNDAAKPAYSGGYVGQAEQVRSTQREIIEVLTRLAKFA